jgi:iron complex outermembrane recepter protein
VLTQKMIKKMLLASGGATIAFSALHAVAQDTPADGAKSSDEIVVTAQRREQRLQDVPLAVGVVSGDELANLNLNNPTELRFVAPSLNFGFSANNRGEGFQIRGIGTIIFSDTIEQSVGTVLDGIPLARTGQAIADLIDVERLEVLRGPQGMLFGKNASAGLINIVTRKPQFENSLRLKGSYATRDEVKLEATGNVKISDEAALRVAYAKTRADGFIENVVRNETLQNRDTQSIRAKFLYEPTEKLSIYVIGDWGESDQLCCAWTLRTTGPGSTLGTLAALNGITPGPRNLEIAADQPFFQSASNWGVTTDINYDMGWATLTSLSGYRRWNTFDNNDPDISPINFLNINNGLSKVDQFSQEFRLTSPGDQRIDWIAGVYYSDVRNEGRAEQSGRFGLGFLPPGTFLGSQILSDFRNNGVGVFGQIDVEIIDRVNLIAGGRYTNETLELDFLQGPAPGSLGQLPGRFAGNLLADINNDNLSGRVTLQYRPTDNLMVYALWARGYKGPGINTLGVISTTPEFVRPEIPTTYEGGLRSTLFGGTTTFNLAGFISNFRDFQASSFDATLIPARFIVTNAGLLKTRGVELDFQSRPMEGLTLSGGLAYVDSEFGEFENIPCFPGQPVLPIGTPRTSPRQCITVVGTQAVTTGNGLPLPNTPKLTYNLAVDKTHPIGSFTLGAGVNWFWRDNVSFTASGDPLMVQEAYGLLGANIRLGPSNGNWQLSLFGKNLLDKNFANVVFASPVLNTPGDSVQLPSPDARRILGVALEVSLGG